MVEVEIPASPMYTTKRRILSSHVGTCSSSISRNWINLSQAELYVCLVDSVMERSFQASQRLRRSSTETRELVMDPGQPTEPV